MYAAGTNAHRWGWLVSRIDSTASMAQPAAKASRAEPVMTCSASPAKTTRVRNRAPMSPVATEPATMGPIGRPGSPAGGGLMDVR